MFSAAASPAAPSSLTAGTARAIELVVIHCSATASGKWLGVRASPARRIPPTEVIDAWHALRGFARAPEARERFNGELGSIGYHYVIDLDGAVLTGRHPDEVGAHVRGYNAKSLGICLVGGAEPLAAYSTAQWLALSLLVRSLVDSLAVRAVVGHRDLSLDRDADGVVEPHEWLKTCPGFSVREWLLRGMGVMLGHALEMPDAPEAKRA